jgi:magnesium transporter
MLQCFGIENGSIVPREAGTATILVFTNPDEAEKRALVDGHGVDPHDLASALDPDELGRIDSSERHADIIVKRPRNYSGGENLLFTVASLGIFFRERGRLVIVASDDQPLFEERTGLKVRDGKDVILKILYGTISHFLGHLRTINALSESLEKRLTTSMESRRLLDMFTLGKSLVYFVNGIDSNQAVLEKMRTDADDLGFSASQLETLDEVLIENRQCAKQAEIYSSILTGLMDARFSIVNANLNTLMKRLTIISVIFMPLNLLAGIGGMSEFSAWTQGMPWWAAYGFFVLGLVPIAFLTWMVLERTGRDRAAEKVRRPARRSPGAQLSA